MLSAILFAHLAAQQCRKTTTDIPEVWSLRSFRTINPMQIVYLFFHREEPCCVTTHWTQLTYRFHGRTVQPFLPSSARGCDEPTSRCQSRPSIGTLRADKPVIPGVSFIRWSTLFPHTSAGSLPHTFVFLFYRHSLYVNKKKPLYSCNAISSPAWPVCLTVKQGYWVVRQSNRNKQWYLTLARPWYFFRGLRPR